MSKVSFTQKQQEKIKKAVNQKLGVTLRMKMDQFTRGKDDIALTQTQLKQIQKSKQGILLKLSSAQLQYNKKIHGGILPFLAPLIPLITAATAAAPVIAKTVALGGLAGLGGSAAKAVVDKISGKGLFLKRGSNVASIIPYGKNQLSLKKSHHRLMGGDGLYLGSKKIEGRGLILGPNSPFKNIPLLNILL